MQNTQEFLPISTSGDKMVKITKIYRYDDINPFWRHLMTHTLECVT